MPSNFLLRIRKASPNRRFSGKAFEFILISVVLQSKIWLTGRGPAGGGATGAGEGAAAEGIDATPTGTDTDTGTSTTAVVDGDTGRADAVSKVLTGLKTGSGSSASSATYRAVHNHKHSLPLKAYFVLLFHKVLVTVFNSTSAVFPD